MLKPGIIRFILALAVVLFHTTKLVFIGHLAVHCFFILSGYWVTFMYENKYSKLQSTVKVFYISRIWRLFPVFLLFNLLGFVMSYFLNRDLYEASLNIDGSFTSIIEWLPNIILLGFNHLKSTVLIPAWSLDIELQFYIVYPALLLLLKKKNQLSLGVLFVVTAITLLFFHDNPLSKSLLSYVFYFALGIMMYLKKYTFTKKTELLFTLLFIAILLIQYVVPDLRKLTIQDNSTAYNRYLNELLPFLLIPLISNSVKNKSTKLDRVLGDISFVIYLCHWVLLLPYSDLVEGMSIKQRLPYSAIYIVTTITLSYIFYLLYDKPIDKLRRKWVQSHSAEETPHAPVPPVIIK